jgi:DDE superfamily endonuclease
VGFRWELHRCFTAGADVLFELADAVLCADRPVRTLVGLSLAPEHRRGHGALYDAVNSGRIDIARLRQSVAALPLPRAADGRLVLAADVNHQDLVTTAHPPGGETRFVAKGSHGHEGAPGTRRSEPPVNPARYTYMSKEESGGIQHGITTYGRK